MVDVSSLVREIELRLFYGDSSVKVSSKDSGLIEEAYSLLQNKLGDNYRVNKGKNYLGVENA